MLKFFRRIRQRLLIENKFGRYLIYAVGEILLVVVGILIALQVNNWNQYRTDRVTESELLTVLKEDLMVNISRLERDIFLEERTINNAFLLIEHLDERRPYDTSLNLVIGHGLYSPDITLSSSSYESIKFRGIDILENDSLQRAIIDLYDVVYVNLLAETVRLENQFWPSSVLPMIHKHFRVDNFRLTPIDYGALLEDSTFKNMVIHRSHFRKLSLKLKIEALEKTENLVVRIDERQAELM